MKSLWVLMGLPGTAVRTLLGSGNGTTDGEEEAIAKGKGPHLSAPGCCSGLTDITGRRQSYRPCL